MEIRKIKAFQTWELRREVMWPDKPIEYVKLEEDEQGLHYGLFIDDQLVSVVSLFIDKNVAQFRKFATQTQMQGKGYGTKLLNYVLEEAVQHKVSYIRCNARTDKAALYKTFGMKETEKRFSKGGIEYVVMEKKVVKT